MTNKPETKLVLCNCHEPEHQLILSYWPSDEPDEKEMSLRIHLVTYDNFFKRLWAGLRFAFGYHCRYGEWDELVLTVDEGKEVWDFLGGFLGDSNTGTLATIDDAESPKGTRKACGAALNRAAR